MCRITALSFVGVLFLAPAVLLNAALAQDSASTAAPAVVATCEIQPDGTAGNCPPTVDSYFAESGLTGAALDTEIATTAAALAQRLQLAESEGDLPLCIDLSQGVLRTASLSSDAAQQQAIEQLATLSCCVSASGASDGIYFGTTNLVPLTGPSNDGFVAQGSLIFSSLGGGFDAVQPGDMLVIESGDVQGYFLISSAVDGNTLELLPDPSGDFVGFPSTGDGLLFEVRRRQGEFADNICTPGFATAAIPIPPAVLASPQ